jgi:hypothetical protein
MTDEQASDWAYKMICCLGISTSNSDINVVGLHKTVKELYEQGRADEREACAKLCTEMGNKQTNQCFYDPWDCASSIRARGN